MPNGFLLLLLAGAAISVLAQQAIAQSTAFPVGHRLAIRPYQLEGLPTGPPPPALGPLPGQTARAAGAPAGAAAPALPAPVPTVRAAARYAPLLPTPGPPLPFAAVAPEPRRYLTGAPAGPPYDLYQHLPEEFRKRTLPAVWAEPLPLQLLRAALGR